ncbi:MAG: energy transducer TonB [Bacteroidota bacterium]
MNATSRLCYRAIFLACIIFSGGLMTPHTYAATNPVERIWGEEDVDQVPVCLNFDQISEGIGYPKAAYDAGIQGSVILKVLVDKDGHYLRHEVVSSHHPLLRIPCEVFAQLLTFKPALKDGQAVKCYTEVEFAFEIPGYGQQ